ncbi:hypothetical protein [Halomonas hibernica]|uniref:hypothetical protein n=2 Tax=Halomonas TaxID=2745 RepID=UPI001557F100|nr:hypothetical protein [Halomonas hibernica]
MNIENKVYSVLASNSWFVDINSIEGNYIEFQITFEGAVFNRVLKVREVENKDLVAFKKKAVGFIEDVTASASDALRFENLSQQDFIKMVDLVATAFVEALEEAYREHHLMRA